MSTGTRTTVHHVKNNEWHRSNNTEYMAMALLSPEEEVAHQAAWPKNQVPWIDPGLKTFLTAIVYTQDQVYCLRLGHGTLARLYPHERKLDQARSERAWLVKELDRCEQAAPTDLQAKASISELRVLLEATKTTEQPEWHMMKAIQRKLHGACVNYLVGLAKIIALPDLDTPGLARKADCSKKTVRALQAFFCQGPRGALHGHGRGEAAYL